MEVNITQKKKHLLLLNRIMRTELKKDIIPTPSKLPEEEVNKYFERLFVKKDDYYIPVKSKVNIKIDEELFKGLIKKPKIKEVKKAEKPVEKPVEKKEKELIKEYYDIFKNYDQDTLYNIISEIYEDNQKFLDDKNVSFFKGLKRTNENEEWIEKKKYQDLILNQLLKLNILNKFFELIKEEDRLNEEWEKANELRNKQMEEARKLEKKQEVKPKVDIINKKDEESIKKLNKIIDEKAKKNNDVAQMFKGKIKINYIKQ